MKVLAIGCHPDDLEIACGGTLRKYVEEGADVYMCHVANGNMGHVEILPEPLREIRTIPVFRRSTMKVPTFSILPMHFRLLKYLKRLDFTGKFNVLTGHFFIENFFRYVV